MFQLSYSLLFPWLVTVTPLEVNCLYKLLIARQLTRLRVIFASIHLNTLTNGKKITLMDFCFLLFLMLFLSKISSYGYTGYVDQLLTVVEV